MTTKSTSKEKIVTLAKQLIAGTAKHLPDATQVTLLGSSVTPADVTTKLQSIVNFRTDVDTAKGTTKAKLAVETANMPALRTFMSAFVTYLKAAYGSSPDVLADFGLAPKTRASTSVEAKVEAVAKRNATRAARHTMGARQKKTVKGNVTGVVVTPVTSAATVPVTAPTATVSAPSGTALPFAATSKSAG